MVVDTSALVAVMSAEPGWEKLLGVMEDAAVVHVSSATLIETSMVLEGRHGRKQLEILDRLLARLGAEIVPVDEDHVVAAREAFHRFGKGRHPARLNFGDLFSYALAITLAEPLLFIGNDFSRTDVEPALPPG